MKKGTVTRWKRPLAAALGALFVLGAVSGAGSALPERVKDALPEAVRETVTPVTTQAAGVDPAMVMGTSSVLGQTDDYNSSKANTQVVWYNGKSWYVIGYNGSGVASAADSMTLFATGILKDNVQFNPDSKLINEYSGSNLQNEVNAIENGFTAGEQAAITPKELTGGSGNYGSTSPVYNADHIAGNTVYGAMLWPLSVAEANQIRFQELREASNFWWLRSPGFNDYFAAYVFDDGFVYDGGDCVDDVNGVRPAFNINLKSVLFTSAAVGGKSPGAGGDGTLKKIEPMSDVSAAPNEWKLTLLDNGTITGLNGHQNFSASRTGGTTNPAQPGEQITIEYSGAQTGTKEYVSAILKENGTSGKILYYGNLISTTGGSGIGTATLTIPSDIQAGTYTLGVFAEQCNGDNLTDYASAVTDIPLTVAGVITTNSLPDGTAGTAYNQTLTTNIPGTATWSITSGTLPPGLSLDPSTGAITGTPTAAGTYSITVNVTDGTSTATKDFSIRIAPASTPTPTPPPAPAPAPAVTQAYHYTAGQEQTWNKGSGTPADFTVKHTTQDMHTYSRFTGIQVDGVTVERTSYETTEGSVIISLSPAYLETLAEGRHTLLAQFTDGSVETYFTVLSAAAPANMTRVTPPQTSDASVPVLYGFGALLLIAIAGLCAGVWRGKRAR